MLVCIKSVMLVCPTCCRLGRLPNVGTDVLITVNVPYPDEDAAAKSMANAECFLAAATGVAGAEASPVAAQAPVVADDAAASKVATGLSQEPIGAGEVVAEKALLGGDGVVDAPQEVAWEAPGARAAAEEGGKGGRELSSCASRTDSDAAVTALRSLLHSFAILDWSLFG